MEARQLPVTEPDAANMIADHLDHFFRTVFSTSDSLLTDRCFRYITKAPHPFGNFALFTRDSTPEDITRDCAPLCSEVFPSGMAFLDAGQPSQLEAASALGFVHGEAMPLMSVTPDALAPTQLPEGYEYREVLPDEDERWTAAVSEGYGLPLAVGGLFSIQRAAERCPGKAHYFAVEHDGQMVATSLVYLHDGLAGIYGVATRSEHRGKGLAAHLTAEPLRMAWERGYTTGLLQASEMGAPVYARIGFRTHGHMELLVHVPE